MAGESEGEKGSWAGTTHAPRTAGSIIMLWWVAVLRKTVSTMHHTNKDFINTRMASKVASHAATSNDAGCGELTQPPTVKGSTLHAPRDKTRWRPDPILSQS